LGLVLHRYLRDLERVDELVRSELEARGCQFADEFAVLVGLHLFRVDLHDREEPLLLDVEIERRFIAGELVVVVLQPVVEVIGPLRFEDLVIERADDAGFQHLDRGWTWHDRHAAETRGAAESSESSKAAAAEAQPRSAETTETEYQMRLRLLALL